MKAVFTFVGYAIYVNARNPQGGHAGFTVREAGKTLVFPTIADAEAEIDRRGYVQSTAPDRDALGHRLKFRQVTAYVISHSTSHKEAQ